MLVRLVKILMVVSDFNNSSEDRTDALKQMTVLDNHI